MKNTIILLLVLMPFALLAQTESKKISISAGYWGHTFINPGAKIGVHIKLKDWTLNQTVKKRQEKVNVQKTISLFVNPQVGFYTKPTFYTNLAINTDIGVKWKRNDLKFYSAVSIGLGYLANFEITSISVNFQGETIGETRERRDFFTPTLNYEVGHQFIPNLGWYAKLSLGTTISPISEATGFIFGELGVKYSFDS